MCKTTKQTQAAGLDKLRKIRPNASAGGKTAGQQPGQQSRLQPEHVPQQTFIAAPKPNDNGFINSAKDFHTLFGLQPQTVQSFEEIVRLLAQGTSQLNRIRIVSHAHPTNLLMPLFNNGPMSILKEQLQGFATSNQAGLLSIIGSPHLVSWDVTATLVNIRSANLELLKLFGLDGNQTPRGNLQNFLLFGFDLAFASRPNTITVNNLPTTTANQNAFVDAYNLILDDIQKLIVGKTIAGRQITEQNITALRTVLAGLTLAQLNANGVTFPIIMGAETVNPFLQLQRATEAIRNRKFRENLNAVKARFSPTSTIDIRGCRIGQDPDYLEAVRGFWGQPGKLPQVSGPEWFQGFPSLGRFTPANEAAIDKLIAEGVPQPPIPSAELVEDFDAWADDVSVNTAHMDFWKTLFQGTAINFCLLAWRTKIPPIGLEGGRLAGIEKLSFAETVVRVGEIFNVAVPASSKLNELTAYVTMLPTIQQKLTATLPASPSTTQLNTAYQELHQIAQQLQQSIVPDALPPNLLATTIQQWKTQLNDFIENTQLSIINSIVVK